jgi:hypothetical protein
MPQVTPAERADSAACFRFPAVARKKVIAAFDGGRITSDGGVLLLAEAERQIGICVGLGSIAADYAGAKFRTLGDSVYVEGRNSDVFENLTDAERDRWCTIELRAVGEVMSKDLN